MFEVVHLAPSVDSGVIATVIVYDTFKSVCVALGLTVLYCVKSIKPFRAVGVIGDTTIMYDGDQEPASFMADFPSAQQVDYLEPS